MDKKRAFHSLASAYEDLEARQNDALCLWQEEDWLRIKSNRPRKVCSNNKGPSRMRKSPEFSKNTLKTLGNITISYGTLSSIFNKCLLFGVLFLREIFYESAQSTAVGMVMSMCSTGHLNRIEVYQRSFVDAHTDAIKAIYEFKYKKYDNGDVENNLVEGMGESMGGYNSWETDRALRDV